MQIYSLSEAKHNIRAMFDSVYLNKEEVVIHRKGRESVVVISLDEYNSLNETKYLLKSNTNRDVLLESLKELRDGKGFERELLK